MVDVDIATRLEIQQLSHRYAVALDRGDEKAWASLFAPGFVLTSAAGAPRSLDQVLGMPSRQLQRYESTLHSITTVLIESYGKSTTGTVYCRAQHFARQPHVGERYEIAICHEFSIVYSDVYERHNGQWKFQLRRVNVTARDLYQVELAKSATDL